MAGIASKETYDKFNMDKEGNLGSDRYTQAFSTLTDRGKRLINQKSKHCYASIFL